MMVLVVTACPGGLRGDLSKWLIELTPGTFVGRPTARVRELLWERTVDPNSPASLGTHRFRWCHVNDAPT